MIGDKDAKYAWTDEAGLRSTIPGRADFAREVARKIRTCHLGQPSTVFGLVGPWGTGKSRLLSEITNYLPDWNVVQFSPWAAGDTDSITREFVAALSSAFPVGSKASRHLSRIMRIGSPGLSAIPFVGAILEKIAASVWLEYESSTSWDKIFRRITGQTLNLRTKVLVVIDDVDRLHEVELYALLRVVRVLGRFANVHYILAYDEDTLRRTLANSEYGPSSFLEKIVQYPFEVPPVSLVERRRWGREIVDTFDEMPIASNLYSDDERESLIKALAQALETPRSANRLIEQLATTAPLAVAAELFTPDFIAITWIRLNHHGLWDDIRRNRDKYQSWTASGDADALKRQLNNVTSEVGTIHVAGVTEILDVLFTDKWTPIASPGVRRMRNPRYFDRYFHLNIAEDDVNEYRVERALEALHADNAATSDVIYLKDSILGSDSEKALLALDYARVSAMNNDGSSRSGLRFAWDMHTILVHRPNRSVHLYASIDKWLAAEIFRAVRDATWAHEELIALVGYDQIVSSAYWARRSGLSTKEAIPSLYSDFCIKWMSDIEPVALQSLLLRPELYSMATLTRLSTSGGQYMHFLSSKIKSLNDYINCAKVFVSVNEWVGTGVRYEPQFNEFDFRYAVSAQVISEYSHDLPLPDPDSLVGERMTQVYPSQGQLRAVALQGLHKIDLSRSQIDDEGSSNTDA